MLDEALKAAGLTGVTGLAANGLVRTAGVPVVSDPLSVLTAGAATQGALQRHAESFFQANRFLLPALVGAVTAAVPADGAVLDLYAGVGLFSVALAALGRRGITAVEGDRTSGRDLLRNATPFASALRVSVESVEQYLKRRARTGGDDHRRPAENRHLARGDDRRRARGGGEGGLRVVRSRHDGARCAASGRWGIRAGVADRLRPVPEHAARRVAGRVCRASAWLPASAGRLRLSSVLGAASRILPAEAGSHTVAALPPPRTRRTAAGTRRSPRSSPDATARRCRTRHRASRSLRRRRRRRGR